MTTWNHAVIVLVALGLAWGASTAHAQSGHTAAARSLQEQARTGDAAAQARLGVALINGEGVKKDVAAGLVLIRTAAEKAHPPALRLLGDIFSAGKLVRLDDDLAVHLYRAAAERGDAEAQAELGMRYMRGRGVPQDHDAALHWQLKAAAGGSAKAACVLVYTLVFPAAAGASRACDSGRSPRELARRPISEAQSRHDPALLLQKTGTRVPGCHPCRLAERTGGAAARPRAD